MYVIKNWKDCTLGQSGNMVEVFKTNIRTKSQALKVASLLQPMKVNFDLEDCDKILRVEDDQINAEAIVQFVTAQGFVCTLLED